ncbi:MAG TPA: hypothetical protein VKE25_00765 [Actinomycetes bacterium]|nr:hypothetical protein [Actinomycetes bacterium]
MTGAARSAEDYFADLVDLLVSEPGVTPPAPAGRAAQTFGSSALKVNNKIFAMLSGGRLVVKLPADRVRTLISADQGTTFDAGKGTPMKEWLAVDPANHRAWEALSREALAFVRGAG